MGKKEGELSPIERIDIINEMVTGEPLSKEELGVIKGLVVRNGDRLLMGNMWGQII